MPNKINCILHTCSLFQKRMFGLSTWRWIQRQFAGTFTASFHPQSFLTTASCVTALPTAKLLIYSTDLDVRASRGFMTLVASRRPSRHQAFQADWSSSNCFHHKPTKCSFRLWTFCSLTRVRHEQTILFLFDLLEVMCDMCRYAPLVP